MKKIPSLKTLAVIGIVILFFLSLSTHTTDKLRSLTTSFFSLFSPTPALTQQDEIDKLNLKITLLQNTVQSLQELTQNIPSAHIPSSDFITAQVILRTPATWNSSLWVNAGTATNDALKKTIVAKNSPVLSGNNVIGVIDYVSPHQSRVRLITDSALTPSVRALRSGPKDPLYLAKGELHGSGSPLWRSNAKMLTGIGFNYDFGDEYSPARDLRTGKTSPNSSAVPLLKVGDILVTSGLDGVFPPNLPVAKITKIHPLQEGDFSYSLEAIPTAANLDTLTTVFILDLTTETQRHRE